jgi:hypothetical protein
MSEMAKDSIASEKSFDGKVRTQKRSFASGRTLDSVTVYGAE